MEREYHDLIQSLDLAFKGENTINDVVGQEWLCIGNAACLLDQVRRRTNFNETCEAMTAKWPQAIAKLVEDRANGSAMMIMLKLKTIGLIPIEPTGWKNARMRAVSPLAFSKNDILPTTSFAPWIERFTQEALSLPAGPNNEQMDAFSHVINYLLLHKLEDAPGL